MWVFVAAGAFSSWGKRGLLILAVLHFLIAVAPLGEYGLQALVSVVMSPGL